MFAVWLSTVRMRGRLRISTRFRTDSARSRTLRFWEPAWSNRPGKPSPLFVRAVPKPDPIWPAMLLAFTFGDVLFPSGAPLNKNPGTADSDRMLLVVVTLPFGCVMLVVNWIG